METIDYKGHTIRFEQDNSPECPMDSWDGLHPMLIDFGRNGLQDYSNGYEIDNPWRHISAAKVSRNWKKYCDYLDIDADATHREIVEGWPGDVSDRKKDYLIDTVESLNTNDKLEAM